MAVPSPAELIETYGARTPEQLAQALHFTVRHAETPPTLPGVTVSSEFQAETCEIVLYRSVLRALAARRGESLLRLEQWHIAHELYHGLAEADGRSPWRVREMEADLWADELLTLAPLEATAGEGSD